MIKNSKKALSVLLSLIMIMSIFTGLEISSVAETDKKTSFQEQELIDIELNEKNFDTKKLPFRKDIIIQHHNEGEYILFITAEQKNGKPICDTTDDLSMSDIKYTLYATKDYDEYKTYALTPEYDKTVVPYPFYFNEFNIVYIEEKGIYYIANSITLAYDNPPFQYNYGVFFDGEKITVLDKNIASAELKKVKDKYVLIDTHSHIIDIKETERIDERTAYYDISVCLYYYVSEDLEIWTYTQGPIHTINNVKYSDNDIPQLGFSFDSLGYSFLLEDTLGDCLCLRYYRNRSGDTTWDDFADVYYSTDAVNFIELEGTSEQYEVAAVGNILSKPYAFIWDYSNYDRGRGEIIFYCVEYNSLGKIENILLKNIVSNHICIFDIDDSDFFQVAYNINKDDENTEYTICDIGVDGIMTQFNSEIDFSKIVFPTSECEKSGLFIAVYNNNSILVFEDLHTVYCINTPFSFSSINYFDDEIILVGDEIYCISENEILKAIGREPIEYPPVEEPTTEEPTNEEPTTEEPTTEEPTTEKSTTVEPTTEEPTTEEPTTVEPTTEEPTTEEPTTEEPTTQEPSTEKPTEDKLEVKNDSIKVDSENGSATISTGITADELTKMIENDDFVIVDKNGAEISKNALVGTGAKIQVMNKDGKVVNEYTVIVPTDIDGNGKTTAADARLALRASAKIDTIDGIYAIAADSNNDGKITAMDARTILRKAAGLE